MYVDYELAWLKLKAMIVEKRSHGKRELIDAMVQIEIETMVPEGQEGFDSAPAQPARLRVAGDS